ncbi:MAG: hypothetical protein R3F20_08480 [Planctomycetota bacterium]
MTSPAPVAPLLPDAEKLVDEIACLVEKLGFPPTSMPFRSLHKILLDDVLWYVEQLESGDFER